MKKQFDPQAGLTINLTGKCIEFRNARYLLTPLQVAILTYLHKESEALYGINIKASADEISAYLLTHTVHRNITAETITQELNHLLAAVPALFDGEYLGFNETTKRWTYDPHGKFRTRDGQPTLKVIPTP